MSGDATLRSVTEGEQAEALALWYAVFSESPGFFERYFRPEFGYQEGDTLGAWHDGALVSAVHVCRRPVTWDGQTLLCGGIANVATLPEFRRRGLSRRLLELAIAKMEREGFHFSLLGTGVPGHYAVLGWELSQAPRLTIQLAATPTADAGEWSRLTSVSALPPLYAAAPRPLQFERSPAYFDGWAGWNGRRQPTFLHALSGRGYVVVGLPDDASHAASAFEWRAADAATEQFLLTAAAAEASRRGHARLWLPARPQHLGDAFLTTLGIVTTEHDAGGMARNIGLPDDRYQRLLDAYRTGSAVRWPADAF